MTALELVRRAVRSRGLRGSRHMCTVVDTPTAEPEEHPMTSSLPLIIFAAEFEQAATVTAVLDAYPREQSRNAVDALYARYGRPGVDLADEYENEIYSIEHGRPVVGVLFH